MDRLLRAVLKPASHEVADACPDAAILAAFAEGNLTSGEQSTLDAHVAGCSRCQEAIAIVVQELPAEGGEGQVTPQESGWFTWVTRPRLRWLVPISAAATVVVVFFATRPLIAPEGDVPPASSVRVAESMTESTTPQEPSKQALTEEAAPARADELARGKGAAKPEAEMLASRVATEEKRAAPSAAPPAPVLTSAAPPAPPPAAQMAAAQDVPAPAGAEMATAPGQARPAAGAEAVSKEAAADRQRAIPVTGAAAMRTQNMDAAVMTVSAPGGQVRWRFGARGYLSRTVDSGDTWQERASGVTADLLAGAAPSAAACWIVGATGTVLLTTDGERWERRPFPLAVDLTAVEAPSSRSAIVTTRDGRRFETLDAGRTWSQKQP
jgi:hypothetical protein